MKIPKTSIPEPKTPTSRKEIAMMTTKCDCGKTIAEHSDEEVRECLKKTYRRSGYSPLWESNP